ncbi:MAG: hypothetical protein KJN71_03565, partial [Acidimicrobiia bacterium]|nr:hypothetical protein [Acidimicrobiia bacterium]
DTPAEPVPEPEPPAVTAAVAVDDVVDVVVVTEPEPQQPDDAEAVPPSEDGSEDLVAADVEADVDEVDLAQAEEAVVVAAGADADEDSTSSSSGDAQETEQVAMDEVMAAAAGVEDAAVEPGGRRSFLEYWRDPEQRLRYYLRWIATAAVMLVLALVLVWAVGELLDAIGQVTDQFGTQEVDEFESLRS